MDEQLAKGEGCHPQHDQVGSESAHLQFPSPTGKSGQASQSHVKDGHKQGNWLSHMPLPK